MRPSLSALLCLLAVALAGCGDKPVEPAGNATAQDKKDQPAADKNKETDKGPRVVVGYKYSAGPKFKSVFVPKPLPLGQKEFELVVADKTFPLTAGKRFFFTTSGFTDGVDAFIIRGINESEKLDPDDRHAFPTGITFMKEGRAEITMVPITKPLSPADKTK